MIEIDMDRNWYRELSVWKHQTDAMITDGLMAKDFTMTISTESLNSIVGFALEALEARIIKGETNERA